MSRLLVICTVVVSFSAAAAPKPKVVVHPLVISADRDLPKLQKSFAIIASKQSIEQPEDVPLESIFAAQKVGSCLGRDECLVGLAKATNSTYALLVTMTTGDTTLTLTARLVRADGTLIKDLPAFEVEKAENLPRLPMARKAFVKLFAQLRLDKLPVAPEPATVEETTEVTADEPEIRPTASVTPRDAVDEPRDPTAVAEVFAPVAVSASNPRRVAGYFLGGLGVVGLGIGSTFGLVAVSSRGAVAVDGYGNVRQGSSAADGARLNASINSSAAVATVGLAAGAACLAAGISLVVLSKETSTLAVAPTAQGGMMVALSGALP
jgi:hypothetical protein